jgi:hypothetical protein
MSHVGLFLLKWGGLERALRKTNTDKAAVPELGELRRMRNALCHGMMSVVAYPEAEPYLTCDLDGGDSVSYTWTQLDDAIRTIEGLIPRVETKSFVR